MDITLKLMNEMNGGNVNKNVQLCTAIFDVLGKCGDIGTIMKIYQHMVQDSGRLLENSIEFSLFDRYEFVS